MQLGQKLIKLIKLAEINTNTRILQIEDCYIHVIFPKPPNASLHFPLTLFVMNNYLLILLLLMTVV